MTSRIPLAKAKSFIDEINAMVGRNISHSRLNEIEVEAEKLEATNPIDAELVLGMIAGVRGDLDQINEHFTAALKAGANDYFTYANYATALSNVGNLRHAVELMDQAVSLCQTDVFLLRKAALLHIDAYDFDGAAKLHDQLEKLNAEIPVDEKIICSMHLKELLRDAGADWQQVSDRKKIAMNAIFPHCGSPSASNVELHEDIIFHSFVLDADLEKVIEAESAMIDAIAAQPYSPVDKVVYFSCEMK